MKYLLILFIGFLGSLLLSLNAAAQNAVPEAAAKVVDIPKKPVPEFKLPDNKPTPIVQGALPVASTVSAKQSEPAVEPIDPGKGKKIESKPEPVNRDRPKAATLVLPGKTEAAKPPLKGSGPVAAPVNQ